MTRFSDIFGQDAAITWLRHALETDRLPHGLIFAGPAGVGKATTARALGAAFLCQQPAGPEPCGTCASCRVFDAGNHPDFHEIVKEHIRYHDRTGKSKGITLSINVIRPELIEPASRKAVMGRGKVFVIEQADLMNDDAQNAMLKTLEEPAGRTLIILLTDQPGGLLPTIRSRCQLVRFAPLEESLVRRELERRKIDIKTAADAAAIADGSLGLALKWIEDGVVEHARDLTSQIEDLLRGQPPENLPLWLDNAAKGYAEKQLERDDLASKDQATREGMTLYLHVAATRFRKRLGETTDPDDLERACTAIDATVRAEQYLHANVNVALTLQQLAITLERTLAGDPQARSA
ncbi:MAG TPA: DNA polymerase III subunit delta' [Tepidisphaeraceae bacterium]|nr:DNA polymerase III subunit delta' [Tepidisphaeraceae bacterium]